MFQYDEKENRAPDLLHYCGHPGCSMVFSMIASGLVYAGAVSSKELKSKLSDLEDQKTSVKAEAG